MASLLAAEEVAPSFEDMQQTFKLKATKAGFEISDEVIDKICVNADGGFDRRVSNWIRKAVTARRVS